jgi:NADH-quinone oxidoreductase subunit J
MTQILLGILLILSALGVLFARRPVYASLSFLATLLLLAIYYLALSAEFIAVMQVLVYAGAIVVIFMFVIVLFQDAHYLLDRYPSKSSKALLAIACAGFIFAAAVFIKSLKGFSLTQGEVLPEFGTVQGIGKALYVDFFFPFEAVILLFLVSVVGALYVAKKAK